MIRQLHNKTMYVIYSKKDCPHCDLVEQTFDKNSIPFTKYNLGKDFTREQFIKEFGKNTFPRVIDKEGNLIGGAKDTILHLMEKEKILL